MIHFAQPIWLIAGVLACIGAGFGLHYLQTRRQAALEQFASHKLLGRLTINISVSRRKYKNWFILLTIFLLFTALARPQYGYKWVEVKRKGIDLLFALDVSKSMLAEDIKPNRLKRANLAILDFISQLEGDRVGLMPFAGSSYLMCPLTLDYDAFRHSLSAADTNIIPQGGTNLPAVIDKAVETLNNGANHKILIILTDGENLKGDALESAIQAATQGLKIFTVGVGTSEGELIPLSGNKQGFVKDSSGNFVTSRLDETTLAAIAEKSGGLYVPLGASGEGLETIYQEKLALIPKEELAERRHKVPLERPEWPLAAALFLLTIEFLIGERRVKHSLPSFQKVRQSFTRGRKVGLIFILFAAVQPPDSFAGAGEDAFQRGDYLQAAEYYNNQLEQNPDDPVLNYNAGTTAYKNNMFGEAVDAFSKALKSDDVNLQKMAYYNRGNSYYQKGAEMAQADKQGAQNEWQQAISSLDSALELDPDNEIIRENKTLIEKKLEELKKQQEQEKQQQQNDNDQGGEEKQSDQKNQTEKSDGQKSTAGDERNGEQAETREQNAIDEEKTGAQADESKKSEEDPQPIASEEQEAKEQQEAIDSLRQQQGKMTKEEAERLLNGLKNEEGELNFVPASPRNNTTTVRDW